MCGGRCLGNDALLCRQANGSGGSVMFSRRLAVVGEENGEWGQRRGKTRSSAGEKEANRNEWCSLQLGSIEFDSMA